LKPVSNPAESGPYISYGTAIGVQVLATYMPPQGVAGYNQTLGDYLKTLPTGVKIIFTGHSMGGALSPTLALTYLESGVLKNSDNNVLTFPTAGPSPGNQEFTSSYNNSLPILSSGENGYQTWNANVINDHDVVPKAWCTNTSSYPQQNINNIYDIYGEIDGFTHPEEWAGVHLLVSGLTYRSEESGISYAPLQSNVFKTEIPSIPGSWSAWTALAEQEHINQYGLNILGFMPQRVKLPQDLGLEVDRSFPLLNDARKVQNIIDAEGVDGAKRILAEGDRAL
jgi:hypothetical protein